MKPKVLIALSSFGKACRQPLESLEQSGVDYCLNPYGRQLAPEETIRLLQGMDGVIAGTERLDRAVLAQTPALKVISRCGTGLDNVDLPAAAELGIRVYNTPDAHVDAVAELTLAGILNVFRRISYADQLIRRQSWEKPMGRLLRGATVGIVGLGRVGKALVRLLQPFEVTVLASDPAPDPKMIASYGVQYCTLDELLPRVDVLTLHLSYSLAAYHLMDEAHLALMKPTAILVNTARGKLVDDGALYAALAGGRLAGAYLDTFEQEPYVGPLATLPNVVLTPHIGSYAAESRACMEQEAVENLLGFFRAQDEAQVAFQWSDHLHSSIAPQPALAGCGAEEL